MNHHYQVIVIGSGSAGKDAALLAGRAGLRTVLIEAGEVGGVCLHRGVHAVRALRACATQSEALERSARLGTSIDLVESGWADWLAVQRRASRRLTEALGRALDRAKVEVKFGHARLVAPDEVLDFLPVIARLKGIDQALDDRRRQRIEEVKGKLGQMKGKEENPEAYSLVERGVATVEDVDTAISQGPGLRWAVLGPFLNQHLSGGPGGIAHILEHLGPPTEKWWRDLRQVTLTPELVGRLVSGVDDELAGTDVAEVVARRDAVLTALLSAKARSGL